MNLEDIVRSFSLQLSYATLLLIWFSPSLIDLILDWILIILICSCLVRLCFLLLYGIFGIKELQEFLKINLPNHTTLWKLFCQGYVVEWCTWEFGCPINLLVNGIHHILQLMFWVSIKSVAPLGMCLSARWFLEREGSANKCIGSVYFVLLSN